MSKRSAEQALRDELEEALAAAAKADAGAERARKASEAVRIRVDGADLARLEAYARVERARAALAALIPLPTAVETYVVEPAEAETAADPTTYGVAAAEAFASGARGGRRGSA